MSSLLCTCREPLVQEPRNKRRRGSWKGYVVTGWYHPGLHPTRGRWRFYRHRSRRNWGIDTPAPICRWLRASQGCSLPALLCLSLQSAEQTWVAKQTLRKRALGAGNWMGLVCPEILRVKGCRWGPTVQVTAFFLPPCRETLSLFQDQAQSTTSSGKPSPNAPGRTRMRLLPATFACLPRALLSFICQMFLQRQLGARHRPGL